MLTDAEFLVREQCRNLGVAFAMFMDQRRFSELAALFTADGVFHRADGTTVRGRENIARAQATRPESLRTVHQISPTLITLATSEGATGWSSFLGFALDTQTTGVLTLRGGGFFEDRYSKVGSEWLIAERRTHVTRA